jgi:hypothetical protein
MLDELVKTQLERMFVKAEKCPGDIYMWQCFTKEYPDSYPNYHSFTGWTIEEVTEWVEARLIGCHCKPKKWVDKAARWWAPGGIKMPDCPVHGAIEVDVSDVYQPDEERIAWLNSLEVETMVRVWDDEGKPVLYTALGCEEGCMTFRHEDGSDSFDSRMLGKVILCVKVEVVTPDERADPLFYFYECEKKYGVGFHRGKHGN